MTIRLIITKWLIRKSLIRIFSKITKIDINVFRQNPAHEQFSIIKVILFEISKPDSVEVKVFWLEKRWLVRTRKGRGKLVEILLRKYDKKLKFSIFFIKNNLIKNILFLWNNMIEWALLIRFGKKLFFYDAPRGRLSELSIFELDRP